MAKQICYYEALGVPRYGCGLSEPLQWLCLPLLLVLMLCCFVCRNADDVEIKKA